MSDGRGEFLLDLSLHALRERRRREIVALIYNAEEGIFSLDEIAHRLARQEADRSDRSRPRRERVMIDLHHRHLPKLDDAGLISYDADTGEIRPRIDSDSGILDVCRHLTSERC